MVTLSVFAVLLPVFFLLGLQKSARSNSGMLPEGWHAMIGNDQHSYMNMGRKMWLSDYTRVFPRHRTPGYPWLLSRFLGEEDLRTPDPSEKDPYRVTEDYFSRMKNLMILLTTLSLAGVYLACRQWLPALESHLVTWGYAFYLAIFKASFVQPEAIFYPLFFISLLLLWRQLRKPAWWSAALAGGLLALVFILKSAALPVLALFLACVGLKILVETIVTIRSGEFPANLRRMSEEAAKAAVVLGVFVVLLSPYFANSWKMYGNPLWDAHSRHYMWMEDSKEKLFWRNAGLGEDEFEAPEGVELPTSASFFQKHDLSVLLERPKEGYRSLKRAIKRDYYGAYTLVWKVGLYSMLAIGLLFWKDVLRALRLHWAEALLFAGFLAGYGYLYCWYQMIGIGPRLMLALFLPAFFAVLVFTQRFAGEITIPVWKRKLNTRWVVNGAVIACLLFNLIPLLTRDLWVTRGGG